MTFAAKLLAAGCVLTGVSVLTIFAYWLVDLDDTSPPDWAKAVGSVGIALVLVGIMLWPGPSASGTFR